MKGIDNQWDITLTIKMSVTGPDMSEEVARAIALQSIRVLKPVVREGEPEITEINCDPSDFPPWNCAICGQVQPVHAPDWTLGFWAGKDHERIIGHPVCPDHMHLFECDAHGDPITRLWAGFIHPDYKLSKEARQGWIMKPSVYPMGYFAWEGLYRLLDDHSDGAGMCPRFTLADARKAWAEEGMGEEDAEFLDKIAAIHGEDVPLIRILLPAEAGPGDCRQDHLAFPCK